MTQVLIAEDDRAIRESVSRALSLEGYDVVEVADGVEALAHAPEADVVLLDVMMPTVDGLTVCRVLRAQGARVPILIITARTETSDRVSGLDAGADDYMMKPFELVELFARIRALLRRAAPRSEHVTERLALLEVSDLRCDQQARRVWRGDREIHLSKTEFDLLELLMENEGIVLTHGMIYDRIWAYDFGPDSKNLTVYISYLRRKIDSGDGPRLIHTVRGVGYTVRAK